MKATVALTSGGLKFTPSSEGKFAFVQRLPANVLRSDLEYTLVAQKSDGTYLYGTVEDHASTHGYWQLVFNDTSEITVVWAALYEGEYTAETLPEYQPKGYAAELAECMRYQYILPIGVSSSPFGVCYAISATSVRCFISIPTGMRVSNPSVEYLKGSVEKFAIRNDSHVVYPTSVSVTKCGYSGLLFDFTVANVTEGELFVATQSIGNLRVLVNANL